MEKAGHPDLPCFERRPKPSLINSSLIVGGPGHWNDAVVSHAARSQFDIKAAQIVPAEDRQVNQVAGLSVVKARKKEALGCAHAVDNGDPVASVDHVS